MASRAETARAAPDAAILYACPEMSLFVRTTLNSFFLPVLGSIRKRFAALGSAFRWNMGAFGASAQVASVARRTDLDASMTETADLRAADIEETMFGAALSGKARRAI